MRRPADYMACPDAWPALLSREQLLGYLGGVCDATLRKVCPVPPIDIGANVLRWRRADVDRWLEGLPPRLSARWRGVQNATPETPAVANDRPLTAAEKARARAGKR